MSFNSTEVKKDKDNTWFTPKELLKDLGEFDLDPCSMSFRPFDIAKKTIEYDKGQDGLLEDWRFKRLFINPPYGKEIYPFIEKFIDETPGGYLLMFARMGNDAVQNLINAGAFLFLLRKRVKFINRYGFQGNSAGTDSMLVTWRENDFNLLKEKLIGVGVRKEWEYLVYELF